MKESISITTEDDRRVCFSNGEEIYESEGYGRGRWLIHASAHFKPDALCTSWFLKATNKRDALQEYLKVRSVKMRE